MKQLVGSIIKSLEEFSDHKRIEMARRSYPTKMKVIGVTVPNIKVVLKEVKKQIKIKSPSERIALAKQLAAIKQKITNNGFNNLFFIIFLSFF